MTLMMIMLLIILMKVDDDGNDDDDDGDDDNDGADNDDADNDDTDRQRLQARRRRANMRATKPHQKSHSGIPSRYCMVHQLKSILGRPAWVGYIWRKLFLIHFCSTWCLLHVKCSDELLRFFIKVRCPRLSFPARPQKINVLCLYHSTFSQF